MYRPSLYLAAAAVLGATASWHSASAQSPRIALVNLPTGNPKFLSTFQEFARSEGLELVRNPTSTDSISVVVNVREPVSAGVAAWVRSGGFLITEMSGLREAAAAGLLDVKDVSCALVATNTAITFTSTGKSLGLDSGLTDPYRDGEASEFFCNGELRSAGIEVLGTRPGATPGADPIPAILGAKVGAGYVLAYGFDWGDGFVLNSEQSKRLIHNALSLWRSGSLNGTKRAPR